MIFRCCEIYNGFASIGWFVVYEIETGEILCFMIGLVLIIELQNVTIGFCSEVYPIEI